MITRWVQGKKKFGEKTVRSGLEETGKNLQLNILQAQQFQVSSKQISTHATFSLIHTIELFTEFHLNH